MPELLWKSEFSGPAKKEARHLQELKGGEGGLMKYPLNLAFVARPVIGWYPGLKKGLGATDGRPLGVGQKEVTLPSNVSTRSKVLKRGFKKVSALRAVGGSLGPKEQGS